jgi:hypothetical protein
LNGDFYVTAISKDCRIGTHIIQRNSEHKIEYDFCRNFQVTA